MREAWKNSDRPRRPGLPVRIDWYAVFAFCVGTALIAVGLEMFLKPNRLVAGGTQGISILLSHMTEMRLGLFLFLINVPFLFVGARSGNGRSTAFVRTAALGATAAVAILLDPLPPLTEHYLAASMLGGLSLGCGTGLVLRIGGYTDGVNETADWIGSKLPLSVAECVMLLNLSVLTFAGLLFGWEQALYSTIAYFVAYQSLRYTMRGRHRYTIVNIRGGRPQVIRADLRRQFGAGISLVTPGAGEDDDITLIISRGQEKRLRALLRDADPSVTVRMIPLDRAHDYADKYVQ